MTNHAQRMGEIAAYLRSRKDGDYMDRDAAIECDQAMRELIRQKARISELEARLATAEQDAERWAEWMGFVKADTVAAQAMVWKAGQSRTTFRKMIDAAIKSRKALTTSSND